MGFQHSKTLWFCSLVGLCALVSSCVTTSESAPGKKVNTGPWLEASPVLRQQIEDEAERLPWTHGTERVEQIHWFATVGEPARRRRR
jgi:hypothetical protein